MAIEFQTDHVQLSGKCRLEDAEHLREWLQQNPNSALDLSACTHVHTGILQIILAHGRMPSALPTDMVFARWLAHYMETLATGKTAHDAP